MTGAAGGEEREAEGEGGRGVWVQVGTCYCGPFQGLDIFDKGYRKS